MTAVGGRRLPSFVFAFLILPCCATPLAGTDRCCDLASQLPSAFRRYDAWLTSEGRGDELGRSSADWEDASLEWDWSQDPGDSSWMEVRRSLNWPDSGFVAGYPPDDSAWLEWAGELHGEAKEDADCRELLCIRFLLPDTPVLFTIGHAAEGCTDVPIMLWERQGRRFQHPLPDFFGYNVRDLWCTGEYLVFHLWVMYEYGGEREGLGFWNLDTGVMRTVTALTRAGVDPDTKDPQEDPAEGPGRLLRNLRGAEVMQMGAVVCVRNRGFELAFWPESREWATTESAKPR